MSKSTPCNLEEVMRGLSISSPSPLVGGELAPTRLEDKTPSFQETVDDVFVDGGVAETCQRGKDDTLDQRELLDSTDALLMDATNKMDDTAFLDEVIARQCRSYGSTDDDYIDEVIARSIKRSMENLLDGDYGDLDGTRYMDEVISRSGQFKKEDDRPLPKTSCQRQQICDNVVKRYLTAVKDSPPPLLVKKATTPQISNRPMVGKLRSPFLTPAQPTFPRASTAAKDKKANVVTVLQKQREVKDWRAMLQQKKEEQGMSNNSEKQLKECKADLVKKELELEEVNRKLASALAAKESLEVKLEDMKLCQESSKENLGAKEEEVRVRNSDITRLDLEMTAKEKMLEEVSNAAIEAEKTIFGYEVSVKSFEGKLANLENENDRLREELSKKRADFEGKCLVNEELVRKLVLEEKHAQATEEELVRTAEELRTVKQKLEEAESKSLDLQLKADSLLFEASKVEEWTKLEAERERKEDFANAKAKFDAKVKSHELEGQTAEKCPECEMWKAKLEDSEDAVRKSNVDLETVKEELGRLQRKETMFKDEIEVMLDTRSSLQSRVKTLEEMVTSQEVKQRGAEAVTSLLEEKLEASEERLKVVNVKLDTALISLEEESRRKRVLQAKVEYYEEKEEKNDEDLGKLKEDLEAKCQEVVSSNQALLVTEVDLKETVDLVETLKKSFEEKSAEVVQAKLMCDEQEKMASLKEAKLVQLEDENVALKQFIEGSQARLEGLEKDLQVKTIAAEKLAQDMEVEMLGQIEYKKEIEEAIQGILASM